MHSDRPVVDMVAVDNKLRAVVSSDVIPLDDASHHIIDSGGKRIRPRLVFLSYQAAGGMDVSKATSMAAAIELVHTATLVHDDINDHSLTRRGKISVHARWGRTFALLTGDYLFAKVYELMAPYGGQYNMIMADACVKLVEGETLQAAAAKSGSMDQATYKRIIERKTASLFEAATSMGALLAGADPQIIDALSNYGHNLGLAFQIVDDVLDIIGDPETLGKPVGSDLTQGAGVIMAQNGKRGPEGTPLTEADPVKQMLAQLRESGAVDVAMVQAHEWAERARSAIEIVPTSGAKSELENLVDLVIERER